MLGKMLRSSMFFIFAVFTSYMIYRVANTEILDNTDLWTDVSGFSSLVVMFKIFLIAFVILICVAIPVLIIIESPEA